LPYFACSSNQPSAHPGTVHEYAALKRELAATHGDDRASYTEAKTAFIEAVLAGE